MISIDDHLSARYTLLTEIHKPTVPGEKERIESLGGQIYGGRVCGILAVSRAFGDYFFKYPNVQANLVSAVPYIQENQLTPKDQFLILACDGLWDVLRYEDVLSLVYKAYQIGLNPNEIARKLAKKAMELGSQDNVTVVVVQFKWEDEKVVVFEPPINPEIMENWEVERFVPRNIYQGYGVQRIFLELQDIPKCTPHWLKLSREVVEDSLKLLLFPKTGYWKGRKFKFTVTFSQNYPKESPRIICRDPQADHPHIDTITGDVSLMDILNEEWTESRNLHDLIFGLASLFTNTKLSPNPEVLSRKT
jgi:ubiquitin-protein ligase